MSQHFAPIACCEKTLSALETERFLTERHRKLSGETVVEDVAMSWEQRCSAAVPIVVTSSAPIAKRKP